MATNITPQYEAVLKNRSILVRNLKISNVLRDLLREVRIKEWIDATAEPDPDGLIQVFLKRIETDVANYEVFIRMLSAVVGMDETVRDITGMIITLQGNFTAAGSFMFQKSSFGLQLLAPYHLTKVYKLWWIVFYMYIQLECCEDCCIVISLVPRPSAPGVMISPGRTLTAAVDGPGTYDYY